jgi:cation-transporting ATPase I
MGLAALICTQLAQTAWAGRRSPLVLVTVAGSFAVLAAVVQTPGVSRFFGCRPMDPFAWAAVLGWSVAGAAGAELVPRWLASSPVQATSSQESDRADDTVHPDVAPAAVADDGADGEEPGVGVTTTGAGLPAADPT